MPWREFVSLTALHKHCTLSAPDRSVRIKSNTSAGKLAWQLREQVNYTTAYATQNRCKLSSLIKYKIKLR